MIIRDIELTRDGSLWRVAARFQSERGRTQDRVLYVETDREGLLAADANGCLLAAFLPTWAAGETRVRVDGEVCPLLAENLRIAASVFGHWYRDFGPAPVFEAAGYRKAAPQERSGVFLSAGIDSMYTLHELTRRLPPSSQGRPRAGLLIDYRGTSIDAQEAEARFEERRRRCESMLTSKGLEFDWLRTDLRALRPDGRFWTRRYHGAMLAALAHFASARYGRFYIASSVYHTLAEPWGSHPITDPLFSSFHMAISNHGAEATKADKVAALTGWPEGLRQVHVCVNKQAGGRNCGRCRKCQIVKLYLKAFGADHALAAFGYPEVTADDVAALDAGSGWIRVQSLEILERARSAGIEDEIFRVLEARTRHRPLHRRLARLLGR